MLYTTFIVIPLTTLLVLDERHFYTYYFLLFGFNPLNNVRFASLGLSAGGGLSWDYNAEIPLLTHNVTSTDTSSNPWWETFTHALMEMNMEARPEVFPAATDSRFLRALGVLHFTSLHFTSLYFTLLYFNLLYFILLHLGQSVWLQSHEKYNHNATRKRRISGRKVHN